MTKLLTKGVHGALLFRNDAFQTANPLTTITHDTYALYAVWTIERREKEVPCRYMRNVTTHAGNKLTDSVKFSV